MRFTGHFFISYGSKVFNYSFPERRSFQKVMVSALEANLSSRRFCEKMGGVLIGSDHVDIEEHRYPTSTYIWEFAG